MWIQTQKVLGSSPAPRRLRSPGPSWRTLWEDWSALCPPGDLFPHQEGSFSGSRGLLWHLGNSLFPWMTSGSGLGLLGIDRAWKGQDAIGLKVSEGDWDARHAWCSPPWLSLRMDLCLSHWSPQCLDPSHHGTEKWMLPRMLHAIQRPYQVDCKRY